MIIEQSATTSPAQVLASLKVGDERIEPTERWTTTWTMATGRLTANPNVYGIYAREIPLRKWLSFGVRDLLDHYPGDVGTGSMPAGFESFLVPDTHEKGLGSWLLVYVGLSVSEKTPRMQQYFGTGKTFTRTPGGQSLHLTLGLLFGGEVDPRVVVTPKARTLEDVLRGSLSVTLEDRMREMRFSYVQAETPSCSCTSKPHSVDCRCCDCSELSMIRDRVRGAPPQAGWPQGARPLINSIW
jgi:hypothetical protein